MKLAPANSFLILSRQKPEPDSGRWLATIPNFINSSPFLALGVVRLASFPFAQRKNFDSSRTRSEIPVDRPLEKES
jgi:hypothetical protein